MIPFSTDFSVSRQYLCEIRINTTLDTLKALEFKENECSPNLSLCKIWNSTFPVIVAAINYQIRAYTLVVYT